MKRKSRYLLSILLCVCVMVACLPITGMAASESQYADMRAEGYWSYNALAAAVDNGLFQGDNNGKLNPAANITRAEAAKVLASAFGATGQASITFKDVASGKWFYNWIAITVKMGIFMGNGDGTFTPDSYITREQAFTAIARALGIKSDDMAVLSAFSDKDSISDYAKTFLAGMVIRGYLKGDSGKLNAKNYITREEFAQVMYNIFKVYYIDTPGVYVGNYEGSVIINVPGVTLKDSTVTGDIIIADGVGTGDVTLNGVTLSGNIIIRGGGKNSLHIVKLKVTNADGKVSIIEVQVPDGGTRVVFEDTTGIKAIEVITDEKNQLNENKQVVIQLPKGSEVNVTKSDSNGTQNNDNIIVKTDESSTSGTSGTGGGSGGTTTSIYKVKFTLSESANGGSKVENYDNFTGITSLYTALVNLVTQKENDKATAISDVFTGYGLGDAFRALTDKTYNEKTDAKVFGDFVKTIESGRVTTYSSSLFTGTKTSYEDYMYKLGFTPKTSISECTNGNSSLVTFTVTTYLVGHPTETVTLTITVDKQ